VPSTFSGDDFVIFDNFDSDYGKVVSASIGYSTNEHITNGTPAYLSAINNGTARVPTAIG
jgi:hypothetical protein